MKTTKQEIRQFWAKDLTNISNEEFEQIIKDEQGFREVAYSVGTYGYNSKVWQGYRTGKLYKVCIRCTKLFMD